MTYSICPWLALKMTASLEDNMVIVAMLLRRCVPLPASHCFANMPGWHFLISLLVLIHRGKKHKYQMKQKLNRRMWSCMVVQWNKAVRFLSPHLPKKNWIKRSMEEAVGETHNPQCGRHRVRVLSAWTRVHITLSGVRFHMLSTSRSTPQRGSAI